jgi:glucosamine--fructose-6-phosphate aminotransferase (isomerizing)
MAKRPPARSAHPYHMYECIAEQPEAIARVIDTQASAAAELAARIEAAARVHVVGIGTSWHASLVSEHMLRAVGERHDARAWNAHEFVEHPPELLGEDVVIVLSHTGRKAISRKALQLAHEAGATTALVTCDDTEADVAQTDLVLKTGGPDRSAAYTMSHTSAMTAMALVAASISGTESTGAMDAIKALPEAVAAAIGTDDQTRELAKRYAGSRWLAFAGGGHNAATAYEAALKINEAAYLVTTGFELEQFLHGPFVATTSGCLVTVIAPPGPYHARAVQLASAAKATGAMAMALVETDDSDFGAADETIELPSVADFLTPIVYLPPLQLFTYWLAMESGPNPDTFRMDQPEHQAAYDFYGL